MFSKYIPKIYNDNGDRIISECASVTFTYYTFYNEKISYNIKLKQSIHCTDRSNRCRLCNCHIFPHYGYNQELILHHYCANTVLNINQSDINITVNGCKYKLMFYKPKHEVFILIDDIIYNLGYNFMNTHAYNNYIKTNELWCHYSFEQFDKILFTKYLLMCELVIKDITIKDITDYIMRNIMDLYNTIRDLMEV